MVNTVHAAGNILSGKVLASSHFPSLCFLNFALKDQCAQGATISPHLSHWLIFSKATRAPSFPAGVVGTEGLHILIYLSLPVVLRTSAMIGVLSSSAIAML